MDPDFLKSISKIVPKPERRNDYVNSITVRTVPFIGRVHIVNDVSGMLQVGFVLTYWVYGTFCSYLIILRPHYNDGHVHYFFVISYLFISMMCLLSLVKASITNPGRIPLTSEEHNIETSEWTFCKTCVCKRPPRAHHCRRCQQCVMRMDHHCPWINNCVGEENHFSFLLLLFYAFLLSFFSFALIICHFWVWPECQSCDQEAFHIKHSSWFLYILSMLALNMACVMFCQLKNQHVNLLLNRTTIENMQTAHSEIAKEGKRRHTYAAYRELCGQGNTFCWLWPCRRRFPLLLPVTKSSV